MIIVSRRTNGTHRPKRSGICKCGAVARPDQGDCYTCHAAAEGRYRQRKAEEREVLRKLALAGMAARYGGSMNEGRFDV